MVSVATSDLEREGAAPWPAPPSRALLAWRDLAEGWRRRWMWVPLALQDIKLRYRGSMLGPFWLTLSTLIMVVAMGLIYPRLFHVDPRTYIPYLALGLIVWGLLSSLATEGCDTFLREESVIQQVPVPFSIHAYRCVCRNFLVLGHNLAIVPVGMVLLGMPPSWHVLEIVPGFALLALNGLWLSIVLGMVAARFRDVAPIVASFMQVLFFLTPVMWQVSALGDWQGIASLNPLFAAIDVVRSPLLGEAPAATSWMILVAATLAGCSLGFLLFARFRTRIAYWI